ncbi:uncharacterized protein ACN63O_012762 [Diretmus argenteus]
MKLQNVILIPNWIRTRTRTRRVSYRLARTKLPPVLLTVVLLTGWFVQGNNALADTHSDIGHDEDVHPDTHLETNQDVLDTNIETNQDVLDTNIETNQDVLGTNIETNQDVLDNNIETNQDILDNNIETNQDVLDTNIETNKDVLGTNIETNQDVLDNNIETNQDVLGTDIETNQDVQDTNKETNQDVLDTNIEKNQDVQDTNIETNQDVLDTNIETNQDVQDTNIETNQDVLDTNIETNQDVQDTNIETNQDVQDTNIETNQDVLDTNIETNQDVQDTNIETNQDVQDTNIETNQDVLDTNKETNQDVLDTNKETNQDVLDTNMETNQDVLDTDIETNQDVPDTDIETNQDVPNTNMETNQDVPNTNMETNQDVPDTNMETNQDVPDTNMEINQDVPDTNMETNQDVPDTNMETNQDVPDTNMETNQDVPDTNMETNQDVLDTNMETNQDVPDTNMETNQDVMDIKMDTNQDDHEDADWHPRTFHPETYSNLHPDAPLMSRGSITSIDDFTGIDDLIAVNDITGMIGATNRTLNQSIGGLSMQCGEYSSKVTANGQCRLTATLPQVGTQQKRCPDMFRCTNEVSYWLHETQNRKEQLEDLRETTSELQEELRNHRHRVKALEVQGEESVSLNLSFDLRVRSLELRRAEADTLLQVHAALLYELQAQLRNLSAAVQQVVRNTGCAINVRTKPPPRGLREVAPPDVQYLSICPADCASLYLSGVRRSGVYTVVLAPGAALPVYCDMETEGGGWTVFQRRSDGSVSFNRGWSEYRDGFGELRAEHWLGNQHLHLLASQGHYSLRIEMEDWTHKHKHALYQSFSIEDEENQYRLHVSGFSGTVEDSFSWYHDQQSFSTPDTGNICAEISHAGWWFHQCFYANLNGVYYKGGRYSSKGQNLLGPDGIVWFSWKDSDFYSLKTVSMMIRPRSFRPHLSP